MDGAASTRDGRVELLKVLASILLAKVFQPLVLLTLDPGYQSRRDTHQSSVVATHKRHEVTMIIYFLF
jgi:hypothetical protein